MFAYTSLKYHCFVYRCQWAYLNLITTIIAITTGNFLHYLCKKKLLDYHQWFKLSQNKCCVLVSLLSMLPSLSRDQAFSGRGFPRKFKSCGLILILQHVVICSMFLMTCIYRIDQSVLYTLNVTHISS